MKFHLFGYFPSLFLSWASVREVATPPRPLLECDLRKEGRGERGKDAGSVADLARRRTHNRHRLATPSCRHNRICRSEHDQNEPNNSCLFKLPATRGATDIRTFWTTNPNTTTRKNKKKAYKNMTLSP